jgi:hypothetical protein
MPNTQRLAINTTRLPFWQDTSPRVRYGAQSRSVVFGVMMYAQCGRLPDRHQLKPPVPGAAPAAWVIGHPLDQYGGFVGIDGQALFHRTS